MSTAIHRRLDLLQAARTRQDKRKGVVTFVEEIRQHLESVDGQADLDMRPGENICDVMTRRLQVADGWNLALMPGDTLNEKKHAVDLACAGKLRVSDEARHAARGWFQVYGYLY